MVPGIIVMSNTWTGFQFDIQKPICILKKNSYPGPSIERITDRYLSNIYNSSPKVHQISNDVSIYFKLPYTHLSNFSKRKITSLVEQYCTNINIKLIFTSFTIGCLWWKILSPNPLRHVSYINLFVPGVIPSILAKLADISPHVFANICLGIGTHMFISICKVHITAKIL